MSEKGFVSLKALAGKGPSSPAQILDEIRSIYFKTTKQTIQNDLTHAIELLKALPDEATRDRAHVYMEGLALMRREWAVQQGKGTGKEKGKRKKARGKK